MATTATRPLAACRQSISCEERLDSRAVGPQHLTLVVLSPFCAGCPRPQRHAARAVAVLHRRGRAHAAGHAAAAADAAGSAGRHRGGAGQPGVGRLGAAAAAQPAAPAVLKGQRAQLSPAPGGAAQQLACPARWLFKSAVRPARSALPARHASSVEHPAARRRNRSKRRRSNQSAPLLRCEEVEQRRVRSRCAARHCYPKLRAQESAGKGASAQRRERQAAIASAQHRRSACRDSCVALRGQRRADKSTRAVRFPAVRVPPPWRSSSSWSWWWRSRSATLTVCKVRAGRFEFGCRPERGALLLLTRPPRPALSLRRSVQHQEVQGVRGAAPSGGQERVCPMRGAPSQLGDQGLLRVRGRAGGRHAWPGKLLSSRLHCLWRGWPSYRQHHPQVPEVRKHHHCSTVSAPNPSASKQPYCS